MSPDAQVRVVIADDHPVFRAGLCALLEAYEDVRVVGQAATGMEAIAATGRLDPHVVVLDLQMPVCSGIEAARTIRDHHPDIGILMLTLFDDADSVFAALRAGARGYLLKDADADDVLRAIRAVASGDVIFGPGVAQRVLRYFATADPHLSTGVFPTLTDGERIVLDLIAAGLNNADIARRLTLSSKTVRNRVSNIFMKLQVADRSEAIVKARAAGLGNQWDERR